MSVSTAYIKRAANGNYYVHWTEDRVGKRVSARTKDLVEAQKFLGTWLLMEHEAPVRKDGENLLLDDVWAVYRERHVAKKVSGVENADMAWRQMAKFFGGQPVSFLSQTSVDEYVFLRTLGKLGRKVKPQTVAKELSYLMAAVKFGARDNVRLLDPGLIRTIELPEPGDARDRWLTQQEIQKLLDAAARLRRGSRLSRGERFIWVALETAGREQAILDLTWDRVDFETNVIHLEVPGRRRTNKRRSTVPISKALRPILERAYEERTYTVPARSKDKPAQTRTMTHVLDNDAKIWATIQLIAIEAGFGGKRPKVLRTEKPKATGISPHVLRHTAATHMARRGVPLWIIAKILGNSVRMVEKVYAKHAPDDLRDAIDLISNGALEAAE